MSTRLQRLNPLLRRELSELLHSRYRDEAAAITVVEVSVSPDLRQARVVYSVLGDAEAPARAAAFFAAEGDNLRRELGRRVVMKYLPQLRFVATDAVAEGSRVLAIMDDLGLPHVSDTVPGEAGSQPKAGGDSAADDDDLDRGDEEGRA